MATKERDAGRAAEGLSAYEKAALGGNDPRVVPLRLASAVPEGDAIGYPGYSEEDQETWRILYERQRALLPGRACEEYLQGLALMQFPEERIPALRDAGRVLERSTRWQIARIPGLLHERDFFGFLARRVFPSTDYIRPRSELDYTPAPDLFHDLFGHTPMITLPAFADFYQEVGRAALSAEGPSRRRIERFYWFTVEFGLIRTAAGLRIYGNGILSSFREAQYCLTEAVDVRPFDPSRIVEQDYDVWHMQPLLFAIDSFEQLQQEFRQWAGSEGLL
jgi:phenylalanine-4-hydroxylase